LVAVVTRRPTRAELAAVVRELAARERHGVVEGTREWVCALCGGAVGDDDRAAHAAGCVWAAAREICGRMESE
jgi:hypothetical protein